MRLFKGKARCAGLQLAQVCLVADVPEEVSVVEDEEGNQAGR